MAEPESAVDHVPDDLEAEMASLSSSLCRLIFLSSLKH